jgi:chromosome segregation ATPase
MKDNLEAARGKLESFVENGSACMIGAATITAAIVAECRKLEAEHGDLKAENANFRRALASADAAHGDIKAENAYFRRALAQADDVIKAERTDMIRVNAQLDGFKADNAKLDASVRELQEALADSSATAEARIRTELSRKLIDRDRQLAASRTRAANLQRRINAAFYATDNIRLALGDSTPEE